MKTQLYRHYDANGVLLYVGISKSAMARLSQHADAAHWYWDIATVRIETFDSRELAVEAERTAIQQENPKHNLHRFSEPEPKALQLQRRADESRSMLTQRIVEYRAAYTLDEVADILMMPRQMVRERIIASGTGYYRIPSVHARDGYKIRVTGWHLIDLIEQLVAEADATKQAAA